MDRTGENYILKATLDEFDEYRMKKNMSDEMKYKEKVINTKFRCILRKIAIGMHYYLLLTSIPQNGKHETIQYWTIKKINVAKRLI